MPHSLEPKLLTIFKEGYTPKLLGKDLVAGTLVGIIALPLSIALAIASGVKPEQGLLTAIVAGFLISALGGSRVQIGGPTGAFIVVVYAIVQEHGYDGLAVATMIAGAFLVILGVARIGSIIKYIPYPVTVGFTSGIALIILTSQIRDLLGLQVDKVPAEFLEKIMALGAHLNTLNVWALGLGCGTLALLILLPKWSKRLPAPLLAIVLATLAVQLFNLPVETIGDRFGAIPNTLPMPRLPEITWERVTALIGPALSIALLGGIESLLSAVVADGMTGRRHRSNMELVAQGVANLASPLFGGIPATGAIARTAANVKSGGATPIAGMWHALTLLAIMLVFGRWVAWIPMAALAGILVMVAYHMSEVHLFVRMLRSPAGDVTVLVLTFLLTVLLDLSVAIQVGVVLSALLFMRRMAHLTQVTRLDEEMLNFDDAEDSGETRPRFPKGVEVFEIYGPFFFGAAEKFQTALQLVGDTKVLIIRMGMVPAIDATALAALESQIHKAKANGMTVILAELQAEPQKTLERAGLKEHLGAEQLQPSLSAALARAQTILQAD